MTDYAKVTRDEAKTYLDDVKLTNEMKELFKERGITMDVEELKRKMLEQMPTKAEKVDG